MAGRPPKKTIESRLAGVERGVKSLQSNGATIVTIVKDMQEGVARLENRIEQVHNHIDGFMKLHERLEQAERRGIFSTLSFPSICDKIKRLPHPDLYSPDDAREFKFVQLIPIGRRRFHSNRRQTRALASPLRVHLTC